MKKFVSILIACLISTTVQSETITMDDLVKKVSENNYQVQSEALKVYQAKQSISVARNELLPSLNIWNIVSAFFDPVSLISQDIAPFLVPANWFRLEQTKQLHLAEKEGYRALWANEIFNAKTLYLQILSDQSLLQIVKEIRNNVSELEQVALKRERLGGLRPGIARELKIKVLTLDEDLFRLDRLLKEEKRLLVYHLGLPLGTEVELTQVKMPDLISSAKLTDKDFEKRVITVSPERTQHLRFIEALKSVKGEIKYSFLGLASNSRGVAGGIFDSLPIASGLGFATAPSLRIAETERKRLKLQLTGIEETLKRDLANTVMQYNLELEAYPTLVERSKLAHETMDSLKKRLLFGEDLDLVMLGEGYRNSVSSQSAVFQAQYRSLIFKERLTRLTLSDEYQTIPKPPTTQKPKK